MDENRIEINGVPHVKLTRVIDNYRHHTPLLCADSTYLRRLGKRRRQRLGVIQHHHGRISGLFLPEENVPGLLQWLTTRISVAEDLERIKP